MRHWTWLAKLSQLFSQITCRSLTMIDCHSISGRSYRQRKGSSETDICPRDPQYRHTVGSVCPRDPQYRHTVGSICPRDPQYRHTVGSFKRWLKRLRKFLGLLNPKVHCLIHKFRYLTIPEAHFTLYHLRTPTVEGPVWYYSIYT